MAEVRPGVIVNASSGKADWEVTAEGPLRLAVAAARHGCRLVHVSSEAVFSGARTRHSPRTTRPASLIRLPYGTAKAAAETGVRVLFPDAAFARTSLIIDGDNPPAAPLELAHSDARAVHHLAGPEAVRRNKLGLLAARRDGLDASRLISGLRAATAQPGALAPTLDVRLDCRTTRRKLRTALRGARTFLAAS